MEKRKIIKRRNVVRTEIMISSQISIYSSMKRRCLLMKIFSGKRLLRSTGLFVSMIPLLVSCMMKKKRSNLLRKETKKLLYMEKIKSKNYQLLSNKMVSCTILLTMKLKMNKDCKRDKLVKRMLRKGMRLSIWLRQRFNKKVKKSSLRKMS